MTASYEASDPVPGSGLLSPATGSHLFTSEGAGQTCNFTVYDVAGNSNSATIDNVNIDKTPPATVKTLDGLIGNDSWYVTDVKVTLTATDYPEGGSGVKEIHYVLNGDETVVSDNPAKFTITDEGTNTLEHWAVDKADNVEKAATQPIKMDKTPPTITINSPGDGAVYILNQVVLADWSAEDSVSGLASATGTKANDEAIDTATVGEKTFTVTATDIAGNSDTKTITYYVHYGFLGLLPPYQAPPRAFKITSSIPLKWQYTDASGKPVDSSSANPSVVIKQWVLGDTPSYGDPITLNDPGSSGLRYDTLTMTWQYNWQTKGLTAGTYGIWVTSGQTGQTNGPFEIQLRK